MIGCTKEEVIAQMDGRIDQFTNERTTNELTMNESFNCIFLISNIFLFISRQGGLLEPDYDYRR